jgi:hypothetical protein
LSEAVRRLKQELKREDGEIGVALAVTDKVVNNKLTGWQTLEPEEAEAILEFLGLPPGALEVSLFYGDWLQAAKPPDQPLTPEQEDERRCERAAGLPPSASSATRPAAKRRRWSWRGRPERRWGGRGGGRGQVLASTTLEI